VELMLPVSKSDTRGTGCARRLRCSCHAEGAERCAAHGLLAHQQRRYADLGTTEKEEAAWEAPLFPTRSGSTAAKAAVVRAWQSLAPEGHPLLGGHSARRSGAKRYARRGWTLAAISRHGRWGSSAVLAYVEEALAELLPGAERRFEEPAVEDWGTPLRALEQRIAELELRLGERVQQLQESCPEKILVPVEAQGGSPAEEPALRRRWLVSEAHNKLHRESSSLSGREEAPHFWRTGCSWTFGRSFERPTGRGFRFIPEEEARAWAGDRCRKGCDLELDF